MHDFGSLVYLDLHKTGSSFVSAFLRHAAILPEVKFIKHEWIREDYRAEATYFITVRQPLSLYSSLYRYGLDGRGEVRSRLESHGALGAYASFDHFVDFALEPRNAPLLGYGYDDDIARETGFMSFRYMKLSLVFPMRRIRAQMAVGRPLAELRQDFITSHILKNETLNADLARLSLELLPQYFDAAKARAFLARPQRLNESATAAQEVRLTSTALRGELARREELLQSLYAVC